MSEIALRNSNHNKLKAFLKNIKAHNATPPVPLTYNQAQSTFAMAKSIMEKTEEIQQTLLLSAADDAARDVQEAAFYPILTTFYEIDWRIRDILTSVPCPNPPPGSTTSSNITIKLPTMELPTFDGSYTAWMSYKDLFLATVDKNRQLSPAQKLQYLKSSLQGTPANLIRSMAITDANYQEAWKLLDERYSNNREIVSSLVNKIFTLKPVQSENAQALQCLIDTTMESLRSLEVLQQPVQHWDTLLITILLSKVDGNTKKSWAMTQTTTNLPTFKEFIDFVSSHIRGLLATTAPTFEPERKRERQARAHHTSSEPTCQMCKGSHPHFKCPDLNNKSVAERIIVVKQQHLCFNCLNKGHSKADCRSNQRCRKCNQKHHTLVHEDKPQPSKISKQTTPANNESQAASDPSHVTSHLATANTQVLLSTAIVKVKDVNGELKPVRIFLDNGSQATLISEECVRRLGISRKYSTLRVTGISNTDAGTTKGKVIIDLHSQWNHHDSIQIEAHILPKVTTELPKYKCQPKLWKHLTGLQLADPGYFQPSKVDILVGADYFAKLILDGRRVGKQLGPDAQNTLFGWVLSGRVAVTSYNTIASYQVTTDEVAAIMKRFWEVEEPPHSQLLTKDERACEEFYVRSTTRDQTGRYIVATPFNDLKGKLGKSRDLAVKRLLQVERRLEKLPEMKSQYVSFMREYQQLGHMEKVTPPEVHRPDGTTFYLPHHCVLNQASTSTKLRVVFDGSAKTTTKLSLNDTVLVGPTVQDDLYDILLRFRTFPIALKADISKMYRQFRLQPSDTDYHRIVWRETATQPIEDYRLLTVTYGTSCAPYLATRCLKQLGLDSAAKYPQASAAIIRDSYVDDLMSGATSSQKAIELYQQLTSAVAEGQLELRKWSSSSATVLEAIPEEQRETSPHQFDPDKVIKALGVQWIPTTDVFTFKYVELPVAPTLTKRKLLSDLAKVFDPLGLISPIVIRAKLILQELWKLTLDWDQPVPPHVLQQWTEYQDDLHGIPNVLIPRRLTNSAVEFHSADRNTRYQLHGFSDASELAYGAVVYLRTIAEGDIHIRMITSKTKVCPLRQITLPRLELMAAVLVAELVDHLLQLFKINCEVFLWTDSTITLTWICSPPRRWKTFVANRVAQIHQCSKPESWRHVPGVDNPADLASRGSTVSQLTHSKLWWNGPTWLTEPNLPTFPVNIQPNDELEERPNPNHPNSDATINAATICTSLLENYSTLTRLKRITAYLQRFIFNSKLTNRKSRQLQPISPIQLQNALIVWIKLVQQQHFSTEISALKKMGKVNTTSKLTSLNPYLDNQDVLRVSGRLTNAGLPEGRKHQIIIPGNCHLAKLIIGHHHRLQLHSGFQLTWAAIQSEYWITSGRDQTRHFIRSCVICRRHRASAAEQLMGNLPACRVTPTRPFLHTGVDYAGPFFLKNPVGRAPKTYKGYLCVFVCMATKAIHLEPVSSLSTQAFIATLRRFVSRRGLCAHIYSDCGTNFVGAEKELKAFVQSSQSNMQIADDLSTSGIQFHFNAPSSPHQGGLWEAGVKSAKFHLRRVMGDANLTFEQFSTILCQVEAILNSRPLYQSSSDPTDFLALTPGHFLIGEPLLAVPDVDLANLPKGRLDAFQLQQQRIQHFWRRWSREYLNTLQQRNKWKWERNNIQEGDLVLIIEDNIPPGRWKMGRVGEIFKGADGKVREVIIITATSQVRRSIHKLVPILQNNE